MFRRLCGALGIPALADEPGLGSDPERVAQRAKVNEAVSAALATHTTAHWTDRLIEAGVPCGPIYAVDAMFADPQVQHLGMARPMAHPQLGDIALVSSPVNFSHHPRPSSPLQAAPEQGEHTDAILHGLGYSAAQIQDLRSRQVI